MDDYIENCQEPDFVENEYIYDDIDGLEEMLLDVSNVSFTTRFINTTIQLIQTVSQTDLFPLFVFYNITCTLTLLTLAEMKSLS